MKFKGFVAPVITIAAVALILPGCGPGHNYHQNAFYYVPIRDFLISKNICANDRDCSAKELIFFEGGVFEKSPIHMNVYNIKNTETAYSILEIVKKQRRLSTVGIDVTIYTNYHLESPKKILIKEQIE